MITHLSSLLHFHLDKVEELVTFAEELDGVKRYAALMDMRYPGKFILDLDVSEETLTTPIPKFTLQPLVENAIFHGLLPKGELGSIVVSGEREASSVLIRVEDDGIGIPEERRHALLTEKPTSPAAGYYHLGLSSIHERLRLYYGESCSLNIISPDQGGTRIELRFPAQGSGGVSA